MMLRSHKRGFTLVELLVSISVIALSMAICLPGAVNSADGPAEDDGPFTTRCFAFTPPRDQGTTIVGAESPSEFLLRRLHDTPFGPVLYAKAHEGRLYLELWAPDSTSNADVVAELQEMLGGDWKVELVPLS